MSIISSKIRRLSTKCSVKSIIWDKTVRFRILRRNRTWFKELNQRSWEDGEDIWDNCEWEQEKEERRWTKRRLEIKGVD